MDNKNIVRAISTAFFLSSPFLIPPLVQAQESSVSQKLSLGGYSSDGNYGVSENTSFTYIPLTYEISLSPWVVSLTVPYLGLEGPADVFLEAGNIQRTAARSISNTKESGIGDVVLSGSYQFEAVLGDFAFLDFSIQLKLPTADENKSLGTGETDVSYQFDLYKTLNSTTLYSTLGYRKRGRTPLYELQDSSYFSLGAVQQLNDTSAIGLIYDFREAASNSSLEGHELMPFYSWTPDEKWNLLLYTIVGFTDSSADQAFGFQISYSF